MSKDKYVIANCPMYFHTNCYGHTGNCECQDCTDCVMKQIVELCKPLNTKQPKSYYNLEVLLAKRILKLLDIQEVE